MFWAFETLRINTSLPSLVSPNCRASRIVIPFRHLASHRSSRLIPINTEMSLIPAFFGRRSTNVFDPFSLDVWDPFQGFPFGSGNSSSDHNSLSVLRRGWDSETSAFAGTRVDWKETPEAHVFTADLPGVKKEEVKVEVEGDRILQISGQRSKEKEEKSDRWHRLERSSGGFLRRFRLPENAKADLVRASMENGVLTVTVPKEEVKKPEITSIEISG